jgi:hypothetical protein
MGRNKPRTKSFTGKEYKIHEYENYPPSQTLRKDPDDWVSGDEPMTGAQLSYLKTLCEQAHCAEVFDTDLTKAEAWCVKNNACQRPLNRNFR